MFKQFSIKDYLLLGLLLFFSYLMFAITVKYIPATTTANFLQIKQSYIHIKVWLVCFYIHVYTSMFALLAGVTQFSKYILKKHKALHRAVGYVYVITVICISGPASFVMGIFANGGILSRISFCTLAVLWIYFTAKAFLTAKQKDIQAHERFMIRSYALTLSAITLRAWKYLLVALFHPRPMDVYMIVAWMGWVLNIAYAEWLISRKVVGKLKVES
jgi:uncharacterized membrane protein